LRLERNEVPVRLCEAEGELSPEMSETKRLYLRNGYELLIQVIENSYPGQRDWLFAQIPAFAGMTKP
jgi:hypothetical protein